MNKTNLLKILSVLFALAVWQLAAMRVGTEFLLASPVSVLGRLFSVWKEPGFFQTVAFSLLRVCIGWLSALAAGFSLGLLAGRVRAAELILWPYVLAVKTVPVASFIILCLIWMDYNALTVLISFLIAFPALYSAVLQGSKNADEKMSELCRLYRVGRGRRLIYVTLPSVKPFLISASGVSIGMAWKAGVAAEVIGMVDGSIGDMLYQAKVYFRNADLLCWTLVIILLSLITEKLFVFLLKKIFTGVEKL